MCDFNTATPGQVPPAPNKRVNYPIGMVLGADEFEQEQAYFLERDRQHNRAQHGYGTVCGLNLSVGDTEVRVSPGLAIDPLGRVIMVCKEQCGDVDKWLSMADNAALLGAGGSHSSLYVTVCYRECLANKVPIPGAPCRSEEDTMDYSRIAESFCLEFHVNPPPALEADVVRSFAQLLAGIQITDIGTEFLDEQGMAELVRGLLETSPVSSPPSGPLLLRPMDVEQVMRTAFRVWVTEVRPALHGRCDEVAQISQDAACILLGRVDFSITNDNKVATGATVNDPKLTFSQDDRPFLLHTQFLQELALHGVSGLSLGLVDLVGDVAGPVEMNTVEKIHGQKVSAVTPTEGQVLTFSNSQWEPNTPPYRIIAAGILSVGGHRKPVFGTGLKLVQVLDKAKDPIPGTLSIHFKGYEPPSGKLPHMYILKAMAVCDIDAKKMGLVSPVVNFDQFAAKGIQIWVTDGGKPVDPKPLGQMHFVVEIGLYEEA